MFSLVFVVAMNVCIPAPTIETITSHIARRAERDAASLMVLEFQKEWTEENTTSPDDVRLKHSKIWRVRGHAVRFLQTLREEDGAPKLKAKPELKSLDPRIEFLARYSFERAEPGAVTIDGRPHWVISLRPLEQTTARDDTSEQKLLNRIAGLMYIDAELGFIRTATGVLETPFGVNIIGRITDARLWLEQAEFAGVIVTQHVVMDIDYEIIGVSRKKRIAYRYSNIREAPH